MNKNKTNIDLSIIIPAYNESLNLPDLIPIIVELMGKLNKTYEIIIINDGSTDDTSEVCSPIINQNPNIKLVELLTNYGKSAALHLGFVISAGNIVITMDADFQDDPNEIPNLVREIENGYDVVVGWKKNRKDPLEKTIPSWIFNKITSRMTGLTLHDYNCGLKAYKRKTIKNLYLYGDLHRFIPILLFKQGYKITEVVVEHHARKSGKSKFGSERYLKGFFDLLTILFLTKYKTQPLHLFGRVGLLFLAIGTAIDTYLSVLWFLGEGPIGNRPLLSVGTLFIIVGVQTFLSGLLAELMISLSARQNDITTIVRRIITKDNLREDQEL